MTKTDIFRPCLATEYAVCVCALIVVYVPQTFFCLFRIPLRFKGDLLCFSVFPLCVSVLCSFLCMLCQREYCSVLMERLKYAPLLEPTHFRQKTTRRIKDFWRCISRCSCRESIPTSSRGRQKTKELHSVTG